MAEVRDLIRSLASANRTVMLSSHLLNEVEQICDSVAILSSGKVIVQGDVADLLHPQEQVRLKTSDDAKAVEILTALDWVEDVRIEGDALVVTAPHDRTSDLSAALGRLGVYVSEIAPLQVSLEQYFLDVTGDAESESE